MLQQFRQSFGVRAGGVLFVLSAIVFITNPEAISFIFLINTVGIDVLLILMSLQFRHYIETIYLMFLAPVIGRFVPKQSASSPNKPD